jgi:hypothetical protein
MPEDILTRLKEIELKEAQKYIRELEKDNIALRALLSIWIAKHQNYRGGSWDYDKELDRLLTDSETFLKQGIFTAY